MKKRKFIWALWMLLFLSGCEREELKTWTVAYELINIGSETPIYRLTYLLQNGSEKSVGPISTRHWNSEDLTDFESGRIARLEMEIISGVGEYKVNILRDEAFHERAILSSGQKYLLIEAEI